MDRSLLWGSLAVGLAGWFVAMLLPGSDRTVKPPGSAIPKLYWIIAAVIPPLIFLASLPTKPPFSEGQGLGCGFLTGGITAFLATLAVDRIARYPSERSGTFATSAPMFLAPAAVAISLLFRWPSIIDNLMGLSIGWLSVTTLLVVGSMGRRASKNNSNPITSTSTSSQPSTLNSQQTLITGAAFAITLSATAALGVYKGETAYDHHRWAALSVVLGAGVPFLLALTALPMAFFGRLALKLPLAGLVGGLSSRLFQSGDSARAVAGLARIVIAGALLLGFGKLLSVKLVDQPHIWHVLAVGLGVPLLVWWLITQSPNHTTTQSPNHPPIPPYTSLLLTAAAFMAIFPLLTGFGIGLAILGGWLIVGIALSGSSEQQSENPWSGTIEFLPRILTFGTIILLYRLFSTRFTDEIRGVGLADQYALFGLIVGAAMPGIACGIMERATGSVLSRGFRLAVCAAIVLLAPGLIILLWGSKSAVAVFFGLALSAGLGLSQQPTTEQVRNYDHDPYTHSPLGALFALATALALTQWLHLALPLASMTRAHKVQTVTWVVGGLMALALISELARKLRNPESAGVGVSPQ